ncbi:periplasmic solute binding protein [Thermodesulfatator indicus DSM 15286]|uniref:Periplasmic solute binding protein n=1 Tax=Thermodesulfatator indicus (strain DSM 15286 / JCM 11887 / CIR29812) TaxID=667014 RepID=F8A8W3_THEID|nr:zinc ABC transporter substrate-binding protein [Thermodesulfatator indicus]AEH44010.1 periplasmic solute binding protein [Thermodesulfatator indicus DSM 15286]
MKRRWFYIICLTFLLLLPKWGRAQEKPLVVASIFPLAELAKAVGGQEIEVKLLLPPGADPHSWEITPQDVLMMKKAKVLVAVGGGLEPWLDDFLGSFSSKNLNVIFMLPEKVKRVHRNHNHHYGLDPHVWLDFPRDIQFVERLAQTFGKIFPTKKDIFLKNAKETQTKLKALHEAYVKSLSSCSKKIVPLAGHKAFGYWEKNYGLHFVALAGLSPEAEPTPKTLYQLIKIMKKEGLKAIYYDEPRYRKFAEVIAHETGAQIFYLSSGAILTQEEISKKVSFWDLMWRNLRYLCIGLECSCPN